MSDVQLAFEELFFGAGSWLGILLLLAIIAVLTLKNRYLGVLMIPVTLFLGIDYIDNGLMWNGIIMFLASVFVLFIIATQRGE